uniref:Ubiquitin carboxyl-terminal hydrolase n=1 Tax=Sexangularia sp. CB-2014 TaxID=1486929 RepID=A0A7S1VDG5_9EUKA
MSDNGWCTIESDPGVFTELIERAGVTGAQVEELFALDVDYLHTLAPVHGLIFLFRWDSSTTGPPPGAQFAPDAPVFFASQVVTNACATQALLHVLLNVEEGAGVQVGKELSDFRTFCEEAGLGAAERGGALGQLATLRESHNSFARPAMLGTESTRPATADDDVFHFVAYIPRAGRLYELDGLQEAPIDLGPHDPSDWLLSAVPAITSRIARYSEREIKFNLLAVVQDRRAAPRAAIAAALAEGGGGEAAAAPHRAALAEEEARRAEWARDNERRRFNYLPFITNFLRVLAEEGKLESLIEKGRERAAEQLAAKRKREQEAKAA